LARFVRSKYTDGYRAPCAVLRDCILLEAEEHGGRFSKTHFKSFFKLKCTQAAKFFGFFDIEGTFVNVAKTRKRAEKQQSRDMPMMNEIKLDF